METNLLVKKAKQGDKDALVELIMLQNQEYYKLAYAFLNNKEDALDAMEDMIVILYERIDRLRKVDAFYNWSKTILVNCCRGRLRRKKRIILYDSFAEETEELKNNDFNQKEERLMLDAALAGLSHKHQEVIRLRYYLDLDYETISHLLKIPLGTVKSRLSTGLKKLKKTLGDEGYGKY
ncbi:MAG: sigma-70 family RNA polymerase sigma factor [Firmicutes bacterium]|nr:sigma-70 family RNA polymerase sigma factor [Bacillota bacterium]